MKLKIKGKFGGLVSWNLVKYELHEVQIHSHSEHSINGHFSDIEVQFYYRAITPGHLKKSAAVSILFDIVPGSTNLFFEKDLNILDLPDCTESKKQIINPIDLRHMFMTDESDEYQGFSYYQYEGSLTSPPCQEETTWYVVSKPLPISYTVVEYLRDVLRPNSLDIPTGSKNCLNINVALHEEDENPLDNIRKIQDLNGRHVYYYENECGLNKKKKVEPQIGHYEKVTQEMTRYYYVNDNKPSGLPNSFVVSEIEAKRFLPNGFK
jgi:hypothetical protein